MGGGSTGVGEEATSAPGIPCYRAAYTKMSSNGQCEQGMETPSYIMIEMQEFVVFFLGKFIQRERKKGTYWLSEVFGTDSELYLQRKRPFQAYRDRSKKLGLPHEMSDRLRTAAPEVGVPGDLTSGQLSTS